MTKIISHRGNLDGPGSLEQNTVKRLNHVLNNTPFSIEVDVWYEDWKDVGFCLGHDRAILSERMNPLDYPADRVYYHAKSFKTWEMLQSILANVDNMGNFRTRYNFFAHDKDFFGVIAHKDVLWGTDFRPKDITLNGWRIWVTNERNVFNDDLAGANFYGICTDYPYMAQEKLHG